MKAFFSEYQYFKGLRKLWKEYGADLISKVATPHLKEGYHSGDFKKLSKAANCFHMFAAQGRMLAGLGTDFFIKTPEITELLLGLVTGYTADILDVFAETKSTAFVIHPIGKPAVLVGIQTYPSGYPLEGTYAVIHESGAEKNILLCPGSFRCGNRLDAETYAEKLAIGLALYMRFFPNSVIDGIPEIASHPSHYDKKTSKQICLTEELVERSGPRPLIRRAHIRFLGSEKFTHAKGSYVLVKTTFVRGKSKIVIEAEQ